jgi:hypothetical protein
VPQCRWMRSVADAWSRRFRQAMVPSAAGVGHTPATVSGVLPQSLRGPTHSFAHRCAACPLQTSRTPTSAVTVRRRSAAHSVCHSLTYPGGVCCRVLGGTASVGDTGGCRAANCTSRPNREQCWHAVHYPLYITCLTCCMSRRQRTLHRRLSWYGGDRARCLTTPTTVVACARGSMHCGLVHRERADAAIGDRLRATATSCSSAPCCCDDRRPFHRPCGACVCLGCCHVDRSFLHDSSHVWSDNDIDCDRRCPCSCDGKRCSCARFCVPATAVDLCALCVLARHYLPYQAPRRLVV